MTVLPPSVSFSLSHTTFKPNGLVHSTETPGGFRDCKFSLDSNNGRLVSMDDVLVIYDNEWDRYPFIGHIDQIHKTGLCYDFVAVRSTRLQVQRKTTGGMSPSHPSGVYAGKIYHAGTPYVETLRDALQLCELVFDGGITDPGLQYVADSINMAGYTAEQMWNYVSSILASLDTPLLWHIRGTSGIQVVHIDFQDTAPRYRVELPEDQIDESWSSEDIITRATTEWGNDQVWDNALTNPRVAGRQLIHDKYINGSNNITRLGDAQALVDHFLQRLGVYRSTSGQLTLNCDKDIVQVKPPVGSADNWPLYLVESGHGIALDNRPNPEDEPLKYIVGTEYTWDTGQLVLRTGVDVGGLESAVQQIVDYNVNRLFFGPYNGPPGGNHPLADADLLPQVGPELGGEVPPSTTYGITAFKAAITPGDPNVKYDKQIDPDLVADEGIEANVNFDPTTLGFQAAIRVIPGTFNEYRLLLGNQNGLIADAVAAEIYRVIPPSEGTGGQQFLTAISSAGTKDHTAAISPPVTLKRGDYAMIKVTTIGTVATWAAVSLHAKKNFPALKS